MDARNGRIPAEIRQAMERQNAQAAHQQALLGALTGALQRPHTVHRHMIHAVAVERSEEGMVLQVGIPSGERLDIVLVPASVQALRDGLGAGDERNE